MSVIKVKDIRNADSFNPERQAKKQTMRLELDIWRDGSGKARVNDLELMRFVKTADKSGRDNTVKMLRQAADMIEKGYIS